MYCKYFSIHVYVENKLLWVLFICVGYILQQITTLRSCLCFRGYRNCGGWTCGKALLYREYKTISYRLSKYFVLYHTYTNTLTHKDHTQFTLLGFRLQSSLNLYVMAFKTDDCLSATDGRTPLERFWHKFLLSCSGINKIFGVFQKSSRL